MTRNIEPVKSGERLIILDALRGFALLGICMANFPEFSLYSFLNPEARESMSTSTLDIITRYFLYIFIDGKFYTIFSLLFGIGFSIIINNSIKKGVNGFKIFYRRMLLLLIIGFIHLMLVWSGDILMLYALVGMFLPLFIKLKDRTILLWASFFLFLPVIIDTICDLTGIYPSAPIVSWQRFLCDGFGINDDNFAYWLRDAKNYDDVFKFLLQGAVVRIQEFVDGNRYFKVLGLFLIGLVIGRNRYFAQLLSYYKRLRLIALLGLCVGFPLSWLYAWDGMHGSPNGLWFHSLIYFLSVYITSFGYVALFCMLFIRHSEGKVWKLLAFPGRMALTNYIGQSFAGMIIFYGIGFGLGADMGLIFVECIAICVFLYEILFSSLWLSNFRFGPFEWIWRCLTYGKIFPFKLK